MSPLEKWLLKAKSGAKGIGDNLNYLLYNMFAAKNPLPKEPITGEALELLRAKNQAKNLEKYKDGKIKWNPMED